MLFLPWCWFCNIFCSNNCWSHIPIWSLRTHIATGATPLHLAVSRGRVGVQIVLCFFLVTLKLVWGFLRILSVQSVLLACVCRKGDKGADEEWCDICSTVLVKTQNLVCASLFSVRSDLTRSRQSFILRTKLMRRSTVCGLGRSIHQLAVCMCFL